jgi:serine/threonine-protein kinase
LTGQENSGRGEGPDLGAERAERVLRIAFGGGDPVREEGVLEAIERVAGCSSRIVLPDPDDDAQRESKPVIVGAGSRYEVLGELARGETGFLVEGRDRNLGRRVALKILRSERAGDDDAVEGFLEEAQIEGQLQHPGVLPIYGLGLTDDGRPYIAMKLVRGETLASMLDARVDPVRDQRRLVGVFEQVCQTVSYAHAVGVIHRDLKPSNIMVGRYGEVHVVDWGLARILGESDARAVASSSSAPSYTAPELARGQIDKVDERADVFALGATLCEILTGEPPFIGTTEERLRHARDAHLEPARARLRGCSAATELVSLALRCLAPQREDRPRDAAVVARAVRDHLAAAAERARKAELEAAEERARAEQARSREQLESKRAAWERRARGRLIVIAAIVGASLLVGGLVYLLMDGAERRRAERTAAEVSDAERTAARAEGEKRWSEALASARQALATARAGDSDPATVERLSSDLVRIEEGARAAEEAARRAEADRAMVARLEEIRRSQCGAHTLDARSSHEQYGQAFRDYGIDVEQLDASAAAAALRARGITLELAAALDDWSWLVRPRGIETPFGADLWRKLTKIARQADPDEWRDRFRVATHTLDMPTMRKLAYQADVHDLPPVTLMLLGRYLGVLGMENAALHVLRGAHARYPGDFQILYELAAGLSERPIRAAEATRFFLAASALRPDYACLWSDLGENLERTGDLKGALKAHRKAVGLKPDHAVHHNWLGRLLLRLDDLPAAETAFRRGLEVEPDDLGCTLRLSLTRWWRGDTSQAVKLMRRATELGPHFGEAWVHLTFMLLACADAGAGDHKEALTCAERAVKEAPRFWRGRMMLGYALYRAGRFDEALRELERARRFQPDGKVGKRHRLLLAMARARCGDKKAARTHYEEALKTEPDGTGTVENPDLKNLLALYAEAAALLGEG